MILVKSSSWSVRVWAESGGCAEGDDGEEQSSANWLELHTVAVSLRRLASGKFTLFCGARMLPCVRRRVNRGDEKTGYVGDRFSGVETAGVERR